MKDKMMLERIVLNPEIMAGKQTGHSCGVRRGRTGRGTQEALRDGKSGD